MLNENSRTPEQIKTRIDEIEKRLAIIHQALAKQRATPFFSRNHSHCQFLDLENKVYSALCNELKWVLNEQ